MTDETLELINRLKEGTDMVEPAPAMPWWQSRIIIGAAVSIATKIAVLTGLTSEFSSGDEQQLVDLLLLILGGAGDLLAIVSRTVQKHAPTITATKKGAEAKEAGWK